MSVDDDAPRVSIVPLETAHLERVVALATHVFVTREPMTAYVGAVYDDIEPFMADVCAIAVRERSGVVAVDERTGDIIGFTIGKDVTSKLDFVPSARVAPVFDLLDQLDRKANLAGRSGEIWHLVISGVAYPRRAGTLRRTVAARGLGVELVDEALRIVATRGYRRVFGECTNARSERIAKLLGAQFITAIRYEDYVNASDGERTFAGIHEPRCAAYFYELSHE